MLYLFLTASNIASLICIICLFYIVAIIVQVTYNITYDMPIKQLLTNKLTISVIFIFIIMLFIPRKNDVVLMYVIPAIESGQYQNIPTHIQKYMEKYNK